MLCCCFAGGDEDYMVAISDIAKVFASELHGLDAVPSDVAVGLILLQQQQDEEEKRLLEQGKVKCQIEMIYICVLTDNAFGLLFNVSFESGQAMTTLWYYCHLVASHLYILPHNTLLQQEFT